MLNKGLASHELAEGPTRPPSSAPGRPATSGHLPRPAPPPVLDPKALAQLQRLDPSGASGFLERVLTTFESSAARLGAKLVDARQTGDDKTVRLVVHTFKSSSASIGATTLAALCSGVEEAIVAGARSTELAPDLDAVVSALEMTLAAIRQRLGSAQ